MYSLILLSVVSLVLALILTPPLRDLFTRWGVVDRPDGKRKRHTRPVARMGGVPIIAACLGAYGILLLTPFGGGRVVHDALPQIYRLLPAVGVVFAVGLVDDIRGLTPWQKLAGEMVAAGFAMAGGVELNAIAGLQLPTILAVGATVFWMVFCTNAVNLIDGLDGLAAGIALLATATTLIAGLLQGNMALAYATAPLAGALLGFLRYNFNPASIFLGDSGSLTLGFLLGCYSVLWSQKAATMIGMTAPLLTLAVPLADAGLAVVRRFLRQQPIFGSDRGHIHHKLLAMGLKPRRVVLLLYAVAGGFAWLSLGVGLLHANFAQPILFLFVVGVLFGIHLLKYAEFGTARRLMLDGAFRRLLNARMSLDEVEKGLRRAETPEQLWNVMTGAYPDFGFTDVELHLGKTIQRHAAPQAKAAAREQTGAGGGWRVRLELGEAGYLLLQRAAGMHNHVTLAASFVELLEHALPEKLAEFRRLEEEDEAAAAVREAGAV